MAFKDELRRLIGQKEGLTSENLRRIADTARRIAPDFTVLHLQGLLNNRRPRDIDLKALAHALGVRRHEFMSEDDRRIAEYAVARMPVGDRARDDDIVERFCNYVKTGPSFRGRSAGEQDLSIAWNEFYADRKLEDELDIFGLGNPDD